MKSKVIYFSQTSNTKKVAEAIYNAMKSLTKDCGIVKLNEADPADLRECDLIGLGCPVFGYREPLNVRMFIDSMPSLEGKHGFMFSTHGQIKGGFFFSMGGALKRRGLIVIGSYHCYAGASLQYLPAPYYTDGHPDEIDLKEAADFGQEMVERSQRIYAGEAHLIPELKPAKDRPFYTFPHQRPGRPVVEMSINRAKCTYPRCRLCMDNCPMHGIDLSVDPPIFRRNCISCYFCEKICPEGAIECDWEPLVEPARERYRKHNEIVLRKAGAQGHFRRLVDAETVNMAPPYYKVYNRHPRYPLPIDY